MRQRRRGSRFGRLRRPAKPMDIRLLDFLASPAVTSALVTASVATTIQRTDVADLTTPSTVAQRF